MPRPFSFQEKQTISQLLEEMGFRKSITPKNLERYSIINDAYIALTVKKPISVGVKLNVPFEIASFQNCFYFQPRVINTPILEMTNFLATNLLHINQNLVLEHNFPIEEKRKELLDILNNFLPEIFPEDNERQWISRIRVALMNKYKIFQEGGIDSKFYDKLPNALESIGLFPTWNYPPSLKGGIPKLRKDSVLFFTNPEQNEYMLIEKGYLTFLRDFNQNNIQVRCQFDSYAPLILKLLYKDIDAISIEDLILSWIRYVRMSLNPLSNVIGSEYIIGSEFYPINVDNFLETDIADYAIPLPALARDKSSKEELYKHEKKLLNNPPSSFAEIGAENTFEEVDVLLSKGQLQIAAKNLTQMLITLNKYRQKIGVVRTLFKLSDIAMDLKKYDESIGYMNSALETCKSGDIPMELIIQTHEKIGNIYLKDKKYPKAEEHFRIIIRFLQAEDKNKFNSAIQLIRLKLVKIFIETNNFSNAKLMMQEVFKESENYPEVMVTYYIERANYFLQKKSMSNAVTSLKKGCLVQGASNKKLALCHFELGKVYLYDRSLANRAQEHLLVAEKLLEEKSTDDIILKMKIYETLSDAFNKTKDYDEMKHYMDRVRHLQKLLQVKGVYQ